MNIWAPSSKHLIKKCKSIFTKQRKIEKKKKTREEASFRLYLFIRVGTFSDDIITTGTSFMIEDSCLQEMNNIYVSEAIEIVRAFY
jgi:hypothetical protein